MNPEPRFLLLSTALAPWGAGGLVAGKGRRERGPGVERGTAGVGWGC